MGRTLWDFLSENAWLRWTAGMMAVLILLLLGLVFIVAAKAGYQFDFAVIPGVHLQQKAIKQDFAATADIQNATTSTVLKTATTAKILEYRPEVSGRYLLLLNLKLTFSAGQPPYFSCQIDAGKAGQASAQNYGFSCPVQLLADLSKGETVVVTAGQAGSSAREVTGDLIALRFDGKGHGATPAEK